MVVNVGVSIVICTDRSASSWQIQFPWRQTGPRPSYTTILTQLTLQCHTDHTYHSIPLHWTAIYCIAAIKQTMLERGRGVSNPFVSLLLAPCRGNFFHSHSRPCHLLVIFTRVASVYLYVSIYTPRLMYNAYTQQCIFARTYLCIAHAYILNAPVPSLSTTVRSIDPILYRISCQY